MRLKTYFFIFLLIASITTISAIEINTNIKVNAPANYTVHAAVKDSSGYWHHVKKDIGKSGNALIGFSIETLSYKLTLNLIKDGETVYTERFEEPFSTGEFQEFDFYPVWAPKPEPQNETINETEVNETNETSEILLNETNQTSKKKNKDKVTAFSVSDGVISINGRMILYTLGIIILAILVFLFIRWEKNKPKKEKKIRITKLSEIQEKSNEQIKGQEDKIEQAKKMLQEAQEELKKLKNKNSDKIEQAKKKLIEDQKELMRLREEARKSEQEKNE